MTVKIHISTRGWIFGSSSVILTADNMGECINKFSKPTWKRDGKYKKGDTLLWSDWYQSTVRHETYHTICSLYMHMKMYLLAHQILCSLEFSFTPSLACAPSSFSLLHHAFEMSVNIDFIYLIDIAHADTGTLHKQWRNTLETPCDERKKGGE